MRRYALTFSLCAGFACAASAFAGVGTTSAGVTTIDPTNPSANVEQQSSGFVAANQQLQNGAAGGAVPPAGVAANAQPGQAGANNTNAKAGHDEAKATAEHAAPAVPPPPPPPPPTYESKMRPVTRTADPAPVTAAPHPSATPAQKPVALNPRPAAPAPVAAPKPEPAQTPVSPPPKVEPDVAVITADPGGGRGAAPDGYTFWFGLLIAGALLALAAVTYLRIQRGETPG